MSNQSKVLTCKNQLPKNQQNIGSYFLKADGSSVGGAHLEQAAGFLNFPHLSSDSV